MRVYLRQELTWARAIQEEFANRHRLSASELRLDDLIMLNERNIKTARSNKSLDHKNMRSYKITRVINNSAYELRLPDSMKKVFPVFHPWLLHRFVDDPLPEQKQSSSPPIHTNDDDANHDAKEILDFKIDKRRKDSVTGEKECLMYKIKYSGYDNDEDSSIFQIYTDAADCPDLVVDFHYRYPNYVDPHASFKTSQD